MKDINNYTQAKYEELRKPPSSFKKQFTNKDKARLKQSMRDCDYEYDTKIKKRMRYEWDLAY